MKLTGEIPDYVCSFLIIFYVKQDKNNLSMVYFILVSCAVNAHVLK